MAFIYDLTDTWNAGGTTFNAIRMNVTDTASAAASKLITLQVGGSERFGVRKDGQAFFAGNVGIGTSSPLGKLQVEASNSRVIVGLSGSDNYYDADFHIFRGALSAAAPERMRINSSGNVGIGTSSPTRLLSVAGTANGYMDFSASSFRRYTIGSESRGFVIYDDTGSAYRMVVDASGNVGIGTTSPGAKLDVRGVAQFFSGSTGSFNFIDVGRTTSEARMAVAASSGDFISGTAAGDAIFYNPTAANAWFGAAGAGAAIFATNSAERMRITSAGNVGIGTTAPNAAAQLQVDSTTRGFLPPRMTTTQRDGITSPPDGLMLYNSTTNKLQVRAAGAWVDLH